MFKPLVDRHAHMHAMRHADTTREIMRLEPDGERNAIGNALLYTQDDWWATRRATDTLLESIGGIVTRVGEDTVAKMMHIARELCSGQICITPDKSAFDHPDTKPWMDKFYTINEECVAEDHRTLLFFARDLLCSDYTGHRLIFQLFAQSSPFVHLAAVYRNFDWDGPLDFVKNAANLSQRVLDDNSRPSGEGAVNQCFEQPTNMRNPQRESSTNSPIQHKRDLPRAGTR
jgi:aromatic ring hydroxylase